MQSLVGTEAPVGEGKHAFGNKVSDATFRNIWCAIVNGELQPGEIVTEEALSRKYDVSRTPLREALVKLIGIGLIVRKANRTLSIAELDGKTMMSLSTTRERLEGLIGYLVCERYRDGEISLDTLEAIHSRMKKLLLLKDPAILLELGAEFHAEMCKLSNNPIASGVLAQILLALEPYRRLVVGYEERLDDIVLEHEKILASIKGGDPSAVETLMRAHIGAARHFYEKRLKA